MLFEYAIQKQTQTFFFLYLTHRRSLTILDLFIDVVENKFMITNTG